MNDKFRSFVIILALILLVLAVNCSGYEEKNMPDAVTTENPTSTKNIPENFVVSPSSTTKVKTKTPAPESRPLETTTPLADNISEQCLEILSEAPEDAQAGGMLFLNQIGNRTPYTLNLKAKEQKPLAEGDISALRFHISPNGEKVAYLLLTFKPATNELLKREIVVANAKGENLVRFTADDFWSLNRWLDNENLLIRVFKDKKPDDFIKDFSPPNFLAYNPFTGQTTELISDYPDINTLIQTPDWGGHGITVYDPTLSYVIYPVEIGQLKRYILYDRLEKKKLGEYLNFELSDSMAQPVWSHDGTKFAVELKTESKENVLQIIDKGGSILTKMNLDKIPPSGAYSYAYNWSPDDRLISFWYTGSDQTEYLGVFNTITDEIRLLCIPGQMKRGRLYNLPLPVWSPDSKSLVILNWDPNLRSNKNRAILVDLKREIAYPIAENVWVENWFQASED